MKEIIKTSLVVLLFLLVVDKNFRHSVEKVIFGNSHNEPTMFEDIKDSFDKKNVPTQQQKVEKTNKPTKSETTHVVNQPDKKNFSKVVLVRGLGNYSESDLTEVSSYIKEFYGYDCEIEPSVDTSPEMYSDDGRSLEVAKCIGKLKRENVKTIYVTNENIVSDGLELRGGTMWRTNTVILESTQHNKKTVLHEIGHTLGLNHCDDKNCLMSIYNDGYEVKDFCNNCKKMLENEDIQ